MFTVCLIWFVFIKIVSQFDVVYSFCCVFFMSVSVCLVCLLASTPTCLSVHLLSFLVSFDIPSYSSSVFYLLLFRLYSFFVCALFVIHISTPPPFSSPPLWFCLESSLCLIGMCLSPLRLLPYIFPVSHCIFFLLLHFPSCFFSVLFAFSSPLLPSPLPPPPPFHPLHVFQILTFMFSSWFIKHDLVLLLAPFDMISLSVCFPLVRLCPCVMLLPLYH